MKITEKPIPQTPPPVTYVLELSFEELVALAILSHRHELKEKGHRGNTFFYSLPSVVQHAAVTQVIEVSLRDATTTNSVDWRAKP